MPLNSLLDLELRVSNPDDVIAFWSDLGMATTDGVTLGTLDRPTQLRIKESTYRHVSEMHLGCSDEADLVAMAARLDVLGVRATMTDGVLRCQDPILDHEVIVEVSTQEPITTPDREPLNRPGTRERINQRSRAAMPGATPLPRRVGHVVYGTPDVAASTKFYNEGIGFRISDSIENGVGVFLRCTPDHHNMLLMPAPIPCMNHYALEMDDFDAIGAVGSRIVAERPEASIYGIGRHVLGANLFWYLLDPAGGMFELFADMDQILDDDAWEANERRDDWDPFTIASWEPAMAKMDFFLPADIEQLGAAREAAGR